MYYIGQCPICRQGVLEILKEDKSGTIYIHCDECEAEWRNPEDALEVRNGTRFHFGLSKPASLEEVYEMNWKVEVHNMPEED